MKESVGNSISYLDREIWRQLAEARSVGEFCSHWLKLQCLMIREVQSAVVLAEPEPGAAFEPVSYWPDGQNTVSDTLKQLAEQALESKQGIVLHGQGQNSGIGYPVWSDGKLQAIVLLEVSHRPEDELRAVLRTLQWGASWLDNYFLRQDPSHEHARESDSSGQLQQVIDLLAQTLEQKDFNHSCMALVNELSNQFCCDRVSLGFKKRKQMYVRAMSHSSQMDKRMNRVCLIAEAMDETADQDATIHHPHDQNYLLITQAHTRLKASNDGNSILSLPLKSGAGDVFAVLTLEYGTDRTCFDTEDIVFFEVMAALLGPVLYDMEKNNSHIWNKVADSWCRQWSKLIGEEYLLRKFVLASLLGASVFFYSAVDEYKVSAEAVIEGEVRRVIAAPFDGYIKEAFARVGDELKKGELLVSLDDQDLRLERLKWLAKKTEFNQRYQQAQAEHDLGESKLAQAQIKQAEAELELVNERVRRTNIFAPFNGLIVDGDLSQSLGSVVQKGDVLFEVTPLHSYRVTLKVDEAAVTVIKNHQQGMLYLTSMPGQTFSFDVSRITPVSIAENGINYFKVEGSLSSQNEMLRPGMEGVGKVNIGERKLFWIWTHEMFDWLRLQLWSMFGLNV